MPSCPSCGWLSGPRAYLDQGLSLAHELDDLADVRAGLLQQGDFFLELLDCGVHFVALRFEALEVLALVAYALLEFLDALVVVVFDAGALPF